MSSIHRARPLTMYSQAIITMNRFVEKLCQIIVIFRAARKANITQQLWMSPRPAIIVNGSRIAAIMINLATVDFCASSFATIIM